MTFYLTHYWHDVVGRINPIPDDDHVMIEWLNRDDQTIEYVTFDTYQNVIGNPNQPADSSYTGIMYLTFDKAAAELDRRDQQRKELYEQARQGSRKDRSRRWHHVVRARVRRPSVDRFAVRDPQRDFGDSVVDQPDVHPTGDAVDNHGGATPDGAAG